MANKKSIIQELETFLQELKEYQYYRVLQANTKATRTQITDAAELRAKLLRDIGRFRSLITELTGEKRITVTMIKSGRESSYDIWFTGLQQIFNLRAADAISYCIDITIAAIGKLTADIKNVIRDKQGNIIGKPHSIQTAPPTASIAHEGETKALSSLKEFLEALGIKYFIAEAEASGGRSIEGQVDWTQKQGNFAIILATKGKAINKRTGKHYMALNIADELGRARKIYGNKIILLVQKGVEVHTNTRGIVYETFTTTNMEKAFIKIIKEVRNWDYLTTGKIKEQAPE